MPVKLDYLAFNSIHCSMKMPMWRTWEVSCMIISNLDFQKLASDIMGRVRVRLFAHTSDFFIKLISDGINMCKWVVNCKTTTTT